MARFSLITAEVPDTLTKRYWLDESGNLCKKSGGQMVSGTVEICEVLNIEQFSELLPRLKNNQALCYGVPYGEVGSIIKVVAEKDKDSNSIARTIKDFTWLDGPGVFFLDHDDTMSKDEFYDCVVSAMPELECVDCTWYPSSSSHICSGETDLTGLRGQRLYFMVDKATEIPRIGETLHRRLWLAGHGKIVLSAAGSMLERGPIDSSVWQSNRLDFASGACCMGNLQQNRGMPIVVYGGEAMAKAAEILSLSPEQETQYRTLVLEAKAEQAQSAGIKQELHISTRLEKFPVEQREKMKKVFQKAYRGGVLGPDFIVVLFCAGEEMRLSVADILADKEKYHGCKTLDPIEPEYNNFHKTGILYLKDSNPTLYSMAHGGTSFSLRKIATPGEVDPLEEIEKMKKSIQAQIKGDIVTIPLPWPKLSLGCRALRPGSMTLIAGPEKVGKSYLTMAIIRAVHEQKHTWKYLPLEDDREAWMMRMLAILEEDYQMTEVEQNTANLRQSALLRREEEIAGYIKNVTENPHVGRVDEMGEYVIPKVTMDRVITWIKKAAKKARVVVVDPLSQIDFPGKNRWDQEADFIRQALGVIKSTGASLILVAHTVKRGGISAKMELTASDVQGSAMLTRLAHTTILVDANETTEREIAYLGDTQTVESNRIVTIAAARFGSGSRSRLAFMQEPYKPIFTELGFLAKAKKKDRAK